MNIQRQRIRNALIRQLKKRGVTNKALLNLVEDYMSLWDLKTQLFDDITVNGVNLIYDNGGGQKGRKQNDSVPAVLKVNQQMLKILQELGVKAEPEVAEGDDEL